MELTIARCWEFAMPTFVETMKLGVLFEILSYGTCLFLGIVQLLNQWVINFPSRHKQIILNAFTVISNDLIVFRLASTLDGGCYFDNCAVSYQKSPERLVVRGAFNGWRTANHMICIYCLFLKQNKGNQWFYY